MTNFFFCLIAVCRAARCSISLRTYSIKYAEFNDVPLSKNLLTYRPLWFQKRVTLIFGVLLSHRATSDVLASGASQILEFAVWRKNQNSSPIRIKGQVVCSARTRMDDNSIGLTRPSSRRVSIRTCGTNLHFRETNPKRFVKMETIMVGRISIVSDIRRTKAIRSFSTPSRVNSSNNFFGAVLAAPGNYRSSSFSSRFFSP
jgi:hypothetical protein